MSARLDGQSQIPKSQTAQKELCCINDIVSDLVEEFEAMALTAEVTRWFLMLSLGIYIKNFDYFYGFTFSWDESLFRKSYVVAKSS